MSEALKTSLAGIELICHFEGYEAKPYMCPGGELTIGYGHVIRDHEKTYLTYVNQNQARQLLHNDLHRFENAVNKLVTVPLEQHQFDALVSFAFNVGPGNLERSTLLKKLNAGYYGGAAEQFKRWRFAGGKILEGLERRRAAEAAMFRGEEWKQTETD